MSANHRRAAITTGLIGIVLSSFIAYLWWIREQDVSAELKPLGRVSEFTYVLDDAESVFSHSDAMQRITVMLQLRNCTTPCLDYQDFAKSLHSWSEDELRPKNPEDTPPQAINFIVMQDAKHQMQPVPEGWRALTLGADESYLAPSNYPAVTEDSVVVIDASGVYRAVLPMSDSLAEAKLQRLLAKLTSSQFLYHYLAKQTLMWEKLRGR